jgi:hypothetical protein
MPTRSKNSQARHNHRTRFAAGMLLVAGAATMLSGCAAIPLKRMQPLIAPPNSPCTDKLSFLANEPTDFHYGLPNAATNSYISVSNTPSGPLFEAYSNTIQKVVSAKMPPGLKQHKVTKAFTAFLTSASGEAQLDAQIADGTLKSMKKIAEERQSIQKHRGPDKLTHGEMKNFADKLFDLQLKPGAAALTNSSANLSGLSAKEVEFLRTHPPSDRMFVAYFEAYYKGNFTDRMSTRLAKPEISTTVPDSEIVAAETVLLEFLFDLIDPTPVMGDAAPGSVVNGTTFYPGASSNQPTAFSPANYVQIPPGSPTACGITTQNVWVLRDLANAAADHAAAVGGLIANTPGGISLGLGMLGKISIGDNQTLSVMVKTAASRVALRATLLSSYWTLRHVRFNVTEPGT